MRSTYGTALYKDTGDIRLVSDVLGHKDINTTAKHYAAMEEEHRRIAATIHSIRSMKGLGNSYVYLIYASEICFIVYISCIYIFLYFGSIYYFLFVL